MSEMTKITIKNKDYYFIKGYKDNDHYRQSFNKLAKKTYGFDFEDWFQLGYWGELYIPFSLLHNEEVVANISVNTLEFMIDGKLHHILQLGTVMTDEAYRGRGLSRELMNRVLREYGEKEEMIYLYANGTVLDFYPKFGFAGDKEYVHSKQFVKEETPITFRRLDNREVKDRALITRLITSAHPVSRISMVGNSDLVHFYMTVFMTENFYYIEALDLVVVAEYEDGNLTLYGVYSEKKVNLDQVINIMVNQANMKVTLGFTPDDTSSYDCEVLEEGDTFFIKGKNLIGQGRFPAMSHA